MDRRTNEKMGRQTDEKMDRKTNGKMDRQTDGKMDGQTNGHSHDRPPLSNQAAAVELPMSSTNSSSPTIN